MSEITIKITLPNGEIKDFPQHTTPFDIAQSLSSSLAKEAIVAKINGKMVDVNTQITENARVEILTTKSPEALEVLRHDCEHLLAQAVKELFPETQVVFGPSTKENGFYYDFLRSTPFSEHDLPKIEKKMLELASKNLDITKSTKPKQEAIDFFNSINEPFKGKIIEEIIPEGEEISLYTQGNFTDLCKGPHYINTKFLRNFKLLKVSGCYWRGDATTWRFVLCDRVLNDAGKMLYKYVWRKFSSDGMQILESEYFDSLTKCFLDAKEKGYIGARPVIHFLEYGGQMGWTRGNNITWAPEVINILSVNVIRITDDGDKENQFKHADDVDMKHWFGIQNLVNNEKRTYPSGNGNTFTSKPIQLQRISGIAFFKKQELDDHITMLEEAAKRDHRKLGTELSLFHISEEAVGSVFWHKNGWFVYRTIQEYVRQNLEENGYQEVRTPQLLNKELWEKSGHWANYQEHMFVCESEKSILALKPMNCPAHIEIFKQGLKSYKDLPIRMAEFGSCHRNEPSGALHGIMRVRAFTQDDAHIFCTPEQIVGEVKSFCELLHKIYLDFGFTKVDIKLSTRPINRAGTDEIWDSAEKNLSDAVKMAGFDFEVLAGEGAFYGPKLEFQLTDAIGRKWQCGTIQLDYVLPERLGANYIDSDGSKKQAVMLHRAILGSFERFIGILIENFAGKLPLWINPIHAVVCSISENTAEYATSVYDELKSAGVIAELDNSSEKISYKIRKYSTQKTPYIITIGRQEQETGVLSVRTIGSEESRNYTVSQFKEFVLAKIIKRDLDY